MFGYRQSEKQFSYPYSERQAIFSLLKIFKKTVQDSNANPAFWCTQLCMIILGSYGLWYEGQLVNNSLTKCVSLMQCQRSCCYPWLTTENMKHHLYSFRESSVIIHSQHILIIKLVVCLVWSQSFCFDGFTLVSSFWNPSSNFLMFQLLFPLCMPCRGEKVRDKNKGKWNRSQDVAFWIQRTFLSTKVWTKTS